MAYSTKRAMLLALFATLAMLLAWTLLRRMVRILLDSKTAFAERVSAVGSAH